MLWDQFLCTIMIVIVLTVSISRGSLLHERAAHVIAFDEKARNERNPCQDSYNDPNLHQCVNETLSYLILCLTLRHVFDDLH